MKTTILLSCFLISSASSFTQTGWKVCNTPVIKGRVDDIFMVNAQIGYAVSGDGKKGREFIPRYPTRNLH